MVCFMDMTTDLLPMIPHVLPRPARIVGSANSDNLEIVRLILDIPGWDGPKRVVLQISDEGFSRNVTIVPA